MVECVDFVFIGVIVCVCCVLCFCGVMCVSGEFDVVFVCVLRFVCVCVCVEIDCECYCGVECGFEFLSCGDVCGIL